MINVGIVGLGNMGRRHLRVLSEMEGVDVWGAADSNPALIMGTEFEGLPIYSSIEMLLSAFKTYEVGRPLDAVVIASPTSDHYRSASLALEASCHVLVEKPFTSTIQQGSELLYEKAPAASRLLMVGLIERFNPAVQALRRGLQVFKMMGFEPQLIEARRSGLVNFRPVDGVTSDLATHDIDVINFLMGENAVWSVGYLGPRVASFEAVTAGLLRYSGDRIGSYTADWLSPTKVRKLRCVLPNGTFFLDYIAQTLDWHPVGFDPEPWEVTKAEPLQLELEYFIDHVQEAKEDEATDEMETALGALNALQIVQRART